MRLSELQDKQKAVIKIIHSDMDLKQRLHAFGIFKNSELLVENVSLSKNTMSIEVEHTLIALRIEEAKTIEVELVV